MTDSAMQIVAVSIVAVGFVTVAVMVAVVCLVLGVAFVRYQVIVRISIIWYQCAPSIIASQLDLVWVYFVHWNDLSFSMELDH